MRRIEGQRLGLSSGLTHGNPPNLGHPVVQSSFDAGGRQSPAKDAVAGQMTGLGWVLPPIL